MSMQSKFSKPSTWLPSWLSSWCSILLVATVSSACGGSGGSGDQGRDPILGLPSATLVALNVSPTSSSIQIGGMQQYVATASFADGSARVVTSESSWTSSVAANASVSNLGAAQGIAAGSAIITAKYADKTATANLLVLPATLLSGINLGVADSFAVLAGNSIINNSGGLTLVSGDVGSPSQTVDPVQTAGFTNYKSGAILSNALAAVQVAITDANSRPCDVNSGAGINLGGMTLAPGVYCYAGAITITGTFTMNGPGLYIFRTSSTLDTSANSIVALIGGASASNVFWVPTAPTTLGANSAFIGTVMATSAAITMGDMATLQNGRVLSASAVTLRNNVITR